MSELPMPEPKEKPEQTREALIEGSYESWQKRKEEITSEALRQIDVEEANRRQQELSPLVTRSEMEKIIAEQNRKIDALQTMLLRAKAQGRANIPIEEPSDKEQLRQIYPDLMERYG